MVQEGTPGSRAGDRDAVTDHTDKNESFLQLSLLATAEGSRGVRPTIPPDWSGIVQRPTDSKGPASILLSPAGICL